MAGWSRREVADDARVRMLLELGQVDLAKTFLLATEYRVTEESDDVPGITPEQIEQLRKLGLWRPLDELITKQLADRARSRTARSKRHVTSRISQHNTTALLLRRRQRRLRRLATPRPRALASDSGTPRSPK